MKRKFTKLMAALALLLFIAPLGMWGQNTYTIGWGTATGANSTNFTTTSGTVNGILSFTCQQNDGTTTPTYNANNNDLRLYYHSGGNGGSITITPASGITITGAVMTTSTSPSVKYTVDGGTATSVSATNNTYTVSGISANTSLKFQNVNTSNTQLRILTIAVTYSITYTVTYDCNGGTSGCPSNVTSIAPGSEINLAAAPSKTGHAFDGWSDGTSTYAAGSPYTVNNDVTMTAQWTAYTITAQSNYASYGTVSLNGFTITASPASGCRYASPAYSVSPVNSATVAQNGNTFTVTPTANTTVTINFEVIPTHTATFSVNGTTTSSQSYAEGAVITFPVDPANIDEMVFMGWTNAAIDGTTDTPPTFVTSATMGSNDVIFYAVFASVTPGTATTVTDELTRETTGVTSGTTTYSSWSGKTSNSDAVYAGNSAGGNNSIQLRTNNSNSGVVTTTSGGKAKKVTITWNSNTSNGRILDIYGKNSAYSAASELYNANNQGTKLGSVTYGGNSTVVTITDDYNFIGMRSNDGAMYITSITIEWESGTPDTYSDYCTTVIIPTVAKPTFSQASGEVLDGTEVTMSCTTEGATIYYSTDDGATWTEGNTYTITENVTLKAKAVKDSDESQVVEATYTVQYILTIDMEHGEYFIFNYHDEDWYDFPVDAEGRPLVHAGDNVRVSVGSVEDCYTLQGLSVTFGENTIVPEYLSETEEYSFIMPASSATLSASVNPSTEYTLTVAGLENASFTQLLVGSESEEVTLDNDHQVTICEQLHVAMIGLSAATGHTVESVTLTYGGQTTEITPESGVYEFTMPSSNVTLTITVGELPTYTLVTSNDQLVPGKHYIIVGSRTASGSTKHYAMGLQNTNNRKAVEVTISNNTIEAVDGIYEFVISGPETINKDDQEVIVYTIFDAKESGYLYATSSSDNYLKTDSELDNNGKWTIAIGATTHVATITAQGDKTHNKLKKNNSNDIFSCYASGQNDVYLYAKNDDNNCHIYSNTNLSNDMTVAGNMNIHAGVVTVEEDAVLTVDGTLTNTIAANLVIEDGGQLVQSSEGVMATVKKSIKGYGAGNEEAKADYYLIASPVTEDLTSQAMTAAGLTPYGTATGTHYDLYAWDGTQTDEEWQNWKNSNPRFSLKHYDGYLYANQDNIEITFTGTLEPYNNSGGEVSYNSGGFSAMTLFGNPFTCDAYLSANVTDMAFYRMNADRNGFIPATGAIKPMEGFFVQATDGEGPQVFSITQEPLRNSNSVYVNLIQGNDLLDRAILRFDNGNTLEKFSFSDRTSKLYIPQGTKDYAVVRSANEGEMPVSFKAEKSGSYTINVEAENVEMNYLRLIDNLTGADIDLLATPNYSFEANTRDYANRFKLVFKANTGVEENTATETFAYFNGSEWVINNNGNATLQVVDMMGRVLSSETISGNAEVTLNQAAGVYVLRLIQGNDVKIQKVVVR